METQTGKPGANFAPASAYSQSFGAFPNETIITAPDMKGMKMHVDRRPEIANLYAIGMKAFATTTGGAGTAGYAMVPIYVDPQVVDVSRKYTPIVEIIPRVTNQGMTADFNKLTAKGGGFTAFEAASLAEKDNTLSRASVGIKFLYAVGRVNGPAQAAVPSYILQGMLPQGGAVGNFSDQSAMNAKQFEVLVQTRAIRELEENLIVNGNATTSAIAGNPDTTEFNGITVTQSTTNKVDKNTTALTLDDINTAIQYAFDDGGRPNFAICSSAVYTDLLGLLTAKIGYMQPTQQVFWGFSTIVLQTMVGAIPVIPSMFMTNSSGSKAIYFLDLSVWEMRVLQDLTYEDLAKTNDSDKFMLKIYETLICRNTAFNSFIGEIA